MVRESVDLLELLRKQAAGGDLDFLREAVAVLAEAVMEAEVAAQIGAGHGERSPERTTWRNGYRPRRWDTRAGSIELQIPKLRQGSYFPALLEPRRRAERALLSVVQQAYVETMSHLVPLSTRECLYAPAGWQREAGEELKHDGLVRGRRLSEDHHDVHLMNDAGERLAAKRLPEGIAGVTALHELVAQHASGPGEVIIGIETDRGPWVAALLAAGYRVYAINPRSAARYRDRHHVGGAKSDAGDAKLLADLVRTDRHNHREVAGDSDEAAAVRSEMRAPSAYHAVTPRTKEHGPSLAPGPVSAPHEAPRGGEYVTLMLSTPACAQILQLRGLPARRQ